MRNRIRKLGMSSSLLFVVCVMLFSVMAFNADSVNASANNNAGATWVPIQIDDITVLVPTPFKVGRPDVGSDCLQTGISEARKFACTFLTDAIWRQANGPQNLKLPYVEYNAQYSPGVPYPGPLLRGEPGSPNWKPFYNNAGYLEGFVRYFNGYQYRYVPWSPTLVDTSCQYALDFGGTPSPRCHPGGLRSQLLGFGWESYGYDGADPTQRYSGTVMFELLDIVNQQQLGNVAIGADPASGVIGPLPGAAVTWSEYGRITYFRPDGSRIDVLGGEKQYLDPGALDQLKSLAASGGGWVELPGSNVDVYTFEERARERAIRNQTGVFAIYLGQNLCYDCYSHDPVVGIGLWLVKELDQANSLYGTQTTVEGFSYTGPIAVYLTVGCASCIAIANAPIASPMSYMPYRDLGQFQLNLREANHLVTIKIGEGDGLPILGSVSYERVINGQVLQWGTDTNLDIYAINPFVPPPIVCLDGMGHDGYGLRFACHP